MNYEISALKPGKIVLNQAGTVESILQNVAAILSTRQQSVPLYRGFGLPMNFIDKPIGAAKAIMAAEIAGAIRKFEPRASVAGISFEIDEAAPGRLVPTVEVEIADA